MVFICTKCGIEKDAIYFNKRSNRPKGYSSACKQCVLEYKRATKDRNNQRVRERRKKNPELFRKYEKTRSTESKERRKVKNREYNKRAYQENKIYFIEKSRRRKQRLVGTFTQQQWLDVCNQYNNQCLRCACNNCALTIDHVLPISKGGTNTIDNVQPLCMACNLSKGTKHIDFRNQATTF